MSVALNKRPENAKIFVGIAEGRYVMVHLKLRKGFQIPCKTHTLLVFVLLALLCVLLSRQFSTKKISVYDIFVFIGTINPQTISI